MVLLPTMLAIGAMVGTAGLHLWGQNQQAKQAARDKGWDVLQDTEMLRSQVQSTADTLKTKIKQQSAVSELAPTGTQNIDMWAGAQQRRLSYDYANKLMSMSGRSHKHNRRSGAAIMNMLNKNPPNYASGAPSFPSLGKPQNVKG